MVAKRNRMKKDAAVALAKLGKPVRCPICSGNQFRSRRALLNTRALTFFNLEWANKKATLYVCEQCGHVLWFLEEGVGAPEQSKGAGEVAAV